MAEGVCQDIDCFLGQTQSMSKSPLDRVELTLLDGRPVGDLAGIYESSQTNADPLLAV